MAKAKTSITTENRSGSAADAAAKEKRTEMPLSDLHPFEGHPFKVLDDELMEQTVESIKQIGVVSPLIVRPDPEGGFEILSGHRRLHAAQLAGLETVPVIVKEMDDDAAIIFMVDSNLQRENILPSERAFSYKMKLEAMKHQGQRGDLTSDQVGQKSWAVNQLADDANESKTQVQRFIRLTNLIREILDMVDEKKIAFNPAVELSYLKPSEQKEFLEAIHSEKDILKLTTTLIANTKGDGKAGDEFWTKAETLLYCALIGYIHYEAPLEEQNFATLIEFLNAMEVREDDETFQNPVDQMFEALKKKKPNHFAVRQYAKFKLAAGDISSK